ncbi:BT4734/BF3469 family protein [Xylanibacter brevis]|uniref:BT4734/BF3469 family protein n=1 Tax=Xylanibacter brevis TaxID=83231 RepID=UPI0009DF2812|nr:BT4734/BF3469 family protein [Xylanibacter brevis]
MFCIQDNQYVSPAVPGTLEKLNEVLDSPRVKWKIRTIRSVRQPGAIEQWAKDSDFQKFCLKEAGKKKTGEAFMALSSEDKLARWATALKESLPPLIFGARDFDETPLKKDPTRKMKRRVLAGIRLSGLFMFDVDHVDNPHEIFERTQVEGFPWDVVMAHKTSSGKGLRLVCKARVEVGNIADNQIELAQALGVKADASCIDASRISYAPMREDVYFLNEQELLNYYNEAFDKTFSEAYRSGHTEPTKKTHSFEEIKEITKKDETRKESDNRLQSEGEGGYLYHGVEYAKICEAWQAAQGGAPASGDRHRTMLQLALDLRYICDNQPEMVDRVLRLCGFVQDVIRERGDKEVTDIAHTACERKLYKDIPKRMQGVLESVGIHAGKSEAAAKPVGAVEVPYEQFAARLEPLLCAPYAEACKGVSRHNWLGAVMASGAMYCTLMTRCWYKHFNGARQRMNPQVLIIGDPASGKSFAKDLDDQIMCAMRAQDEEVRAQETRYKQEQKKRGTSSKAQKQDALVEPEGMIRYLPTKTSNNIFFRRLKRAKEVVDGEVLPMHLYMFDSELDSSISAQSGGAWIGKHDLELKAFHNELSGVDYANGDSINDILPVYWNSVTTGTQISLYKKFTMRNINDGLCSRVAIFQMEVARYQMVKKKMVDWQANEALKQWGFRFEQLHGELPLERLTDHVYELCELSAQEAEAADDHVLDYLRKRAVFYATWLTVPRIIGRQYEQYKKTGQLDISDDDLRFSTLIYDAVIYFQDHFFGQMLQDSWDNAAREFVPRRKNSRNADAYRDLPETFLINDVMVVLDIEKDAAHKQCQRWLKHGFVERVKQGKYKKVVKEIMS